MAKCGGNGGLIGWVLVVFVSMYGVAFSVSVSLVISVALVGGGGVAITRTGFRSVFLLRDATSCKMSADVTDQPDSSDAMEVSS